MQDGDRAYELLRVHGETDKAPAFPVIAEYSSQSRKGGKTPARVYVRQGGSHWFAVILDDPALPLVVGADVINGEIKRLELLADIDAPSLSLRDLRLPLTKLIRTWAAAGAVYWSTWTPLQAPNPPRRHASQSDAIAALHKAAEQQFRSGGRQRVRGADADELLERVVAAYREAVAVGDRSPRVTVGKRLGYTPEHIGKLLVKARKSGLLAPAPTGRAGEV